MDDEATYVESASRDLLVYKKNSHWPTRVPAALVLMARHLSDEHGMSVRQINRKTGLTDLEVRTALGSAEHKGDANG